MSKILFLKPHLEHKIWGSNKLTKYNIDLGGAKDIGEAWVISGYKTKSSVITNGEFKGQTLYEVFSKHKDLFDNYEGDKYPLLVKILDCNDDLSIQVHPNNEYALKHYDELGKNECWYILDAKPNAKLVYGHNAKTYEELVDCIKNKKWDKLLNYKQVENGDFVYVPTGTVHAIGKGIVLYELQQSSDVTFRVYDYDRDLMDKSRKLHVQESIDNITVPFNEPKFEYSKDVLVRNKYFKLVKIENKDSKTYSFPTSRWIQVTIVDGSGKLNNEWPLKKGDSFIVTNDKKLTLEGNLKVLVSFIEK